MTETTVLIGTRESLRGDDRRGSGAEPLFVELAQGFVLVPISEDAWTVIAADDDTEVAVHLWRFLEVIIDAVGLRPHLPGPVAFLELGESWQSGFAAVDGTVVDSSVTDFDGGQLQTPKADWAFNRVLRRLGVRAGEGTDECTALGLTQYLAGPA